MRICSLRNAQAFKTAQPPPACHAGPGAELPTATHAPATRASSHTAPRAHLQALAVVAIVAVNMAVKYSIEKLTHLDQHHIRSREARSLTRALFLTQTLNAGLCLVVANAYLPTVRVREAGPGAGSSVHGSGHAVWRVEAHCVGTRCTIPPPWLAVPTECFMCSTEQ